MVAGDGGWRAQQRIKELFARARNQSPCIIFDEDAIAQKEVAGQLIPVRHITGFLLNEIDGRSPCWVYIMAATNRIDILDPAIIRPGRKHIEIGNFPSKIVDILIVI